MEGEDEGGGRIWREKMEVEGEDGGGGRREDMEGEDGGGGRREDMEGEDGGGGNPISIFSLHLHLLPPYPGRRWRIWRRKGEREI